MKASRLVVVIALLSAPVACDKASNVDNPAKNYFLKYFGNEGSQTGVDVEINSDGTFILFGTTKIITGNPSDNTQFYVAKADALGNKIWEFTYGGPLDEEAKDVELTSSGNIVIVGNSYVSTSSRDILLMTLNPDGTKKDSVLINFKKSLGAGGDADDDATAVTETSDGFIVSGSTDNLHNTAFINREALFARVNADLTPYNSNWPTYPSYGQGAENVTTKIFQQGTDFYCFGYTMWSVALGPAQTDFDYWVFALNNDGTTKIGVRTLGNPGVNDKLTSVTPVSAASGGGYFLAGIETNPVSGNDDVYVTKLKTDPIFDAVDIPPKQLNINLSKLSVERVSAAPSATSGYYVLTNENATGNSNLLLSKLAGDGSNAWGGNNVIFGGQGDDLVGSVKELSDGKLLIIGTMGIGQVNSETKMVLLKVNSSGQFAD